MTTERTLELLDRLIGTWTVEATHPALPGVVVYGTTEMEWLEGRRFVIQRIRMDHPDFPASITIIGFVGRDRVVPGGGVPDAATDADLRMHYFDSRGVFRDYQARIDDVAWKYRRDAPGFSQRFVGTFADDGDTIHGRWELREDDVTWKDDLRATYRRRR